MKTILLILLLSFSQCSGLIKEKEEIWITIKDHDPVIDSYLEDTIIITNKNLFFTSQQHGFDGVEI